VVLTGIGFLLFVGGFMIPLTMVTPNSYRQAASAVGSGGGVPTCLIEPVQYLFRRPKTYIEILSTTLRSGTVAKIIVGVLFILAIATKKDTQRRARESIPVIDCPSLLTIRAPELFLGKLVGKTNSEKVALQRTQIDDTPIQDYSEARNLTIEELKATHVVNDQVQAFVNNADDGDDDMMSVVNDTVVIGNDRVRDMECS